jgi:hypothetical protein
MAFSNSLLESSVFGNKNVQFYSCVADAATGTIVTGFNQVTAVQLTPKSLTANVKTKINAGISGTATAGTIAVTGATSGDEFYLTVYGS